MWWLWNYMTSALKYMGLMRKSGKLVFLGLENAGKTSLLYMMKENKMLTHSPIGYPTSEQLYNQFHNFRCVGSQVSSASIMKIHLRHNTFSTLGGQIIS